MDDTDDNDHKLDGILGVGFNSGSSQVNYGYPQPSSATTSALNAGMIYYSLYSWLCLRSRAKTDISNSDV